MLKIIGSKTTLLSPNLNRRAFLQAGTAAVLSAGFSPVSAMGQQKEAPQKGSLKAVEKAGEKHLLWQPRADLAVRLRLPHLRS